MFDCVISNPPYNALINGVKKQSLYIDFIEKAKAHYSLFIVPAQWMNKRDNSKIGKFCRDNIKQIEFIKYWDKETAAKLFNWPKIIGGVCYFLKNSKKQRSYIKYDNVEYDYSKLNFIPIRLQNKNILEVAESVLRKCNGKEFSFKRGNINSKQAKTSSGNIPCLTASGWRNIQTNKKQMYKNKICMPYSSDYDVSNTFTFVPQGSVCTNSFLYLEVEDDVEALNFESYIATSLVKFIRYIITNPGDHNNTTKTWDKVPKVDLNKHWTDEDVYKLFNITEEEIREIEKHV